MALGNRHVIGRIKTQPALFRNEHRNPCVRGLRTLDSGSRADVTTYISTCEPYGAQRTYHHVCEILADSLSLAQHLSQRYVDGSRRRTVLEFLMNTMREILNRFQQRPIRNERFACELVQLPRRRNIG